jgi:hypothetical protein
MFMSKTSVSQIAYYLALIGGIIMILLGILGFLVDFGGFIFHWGFAYGGIVTLVMGVIAVIDARSASTLVWAIVLIIVGAIGGGLGGLLVVLGGLFGLITVLMKNAQFPSPFFADFRCGNLLSWKNIWVVVNIMDGSSHGKS